MNTEDRVALFRSRVREALHAGWALERDRHLTIREREHVEHAVNRIHEADSAASQIAAANSEREEGSDG